MLLGHSQDVSLSAIDQYMREVRSLARLDEVGERTLLEHIRLGGIDAESARSRLVEGYQPLVVSLAMRYSWRCQHLSFLDLVQEGNIGLLEAVARHDGRAGGVAFRSWAFSWVRGAMLQAIWRYERSIRLPVGKLKLLRRLAVVQSSLLCQHGREPTLDELVEAMQMPLRDVLALLVLQAQQVVSLHRFPTDTPDGECLALEDVISADAASEYTGSGDGSRPLAWLNDQVESLPERERLVIKLRYGFVDGIERTQRQVAELLGMRRSAIEEIDSRVRARLRTAVAQASAIGYQEAA